jgi:LacI family transcriptional regulator
MPTIKDVARTAGVSYTTVSHVLNNSRPVSDRARKSVQDAAQRLNYVPSAVARSLRRQTTRTIGMLLIDSTDPYFAELARGIEEVCFRNKYTLILCNSYEDAKRQQTYLQALLEKRVDGLLVAGAGDPEVLAWQLQSARVPVVLVDRHVPNLDADTVAVDHEHAAYLATWHLLDLGHRSIGCIGGPAAIGPFSQRVNGYRRALAEAGITPPAEWIIEARDLTMDGGYGAAGHLLSRDAGLTAVFASSDMLGIGALRHAVERGIAIPREFSIIGFDGVELGRYVSPALTSIGQPIRSLGALAATRLLERIAQGNHSAGRTLTISPSLVVRESTGPAPSGRPG